MNKHRNIDFLFAALALVVGHVSIAHAEFPIEDMGSKSLGIQYGLAFRGQNITAAKVPSHETIHTLSLAYAPIPYVAVEAGLGLDRFDVETRKSVGFQGEYGISPVFGLMLSSPYFALDLLRVSGGVRALHLNSEDDRGYQYSGFISNPYLGIVLSPSGYLDVETGIRAHLVEGTMRGPGDVERPFANDDIGRGYLTLTVKSPAEGAFLSLDIDMSPSIDPDWSQGPRESRVGVSFGAILGGRAKPVKTKEASGYFPAYSEMKEKQDRMSEEIE